MGRKESNQTNKQLMHHSEFDIFKMASTMVADNFNKSVGTAAYL